MRGWFLILPLTATPSLTGSWASARARSDRPPAEVRHVVIVRASCRAEAWCSVREDAVQMAAARQAGADYLVTRDRAGYAAGPLPALAPAELLALLPGSEEGPSAGS